MVCRPQGPGCRVGLIAYICRGTGIPPWSGGCIDRRKPDHQSGIPKPVISSSSAELFVTLKYTTGKGVPDKEYAVTSMGQKLAGYWTGSSCWNTAGAGCSGISTPQLSSRLVQTNTVGQLVLGLDQSPALFPVSGSVTLTLRVRPICGRPICGLVTNGVLFGLKIST